MRSRVILATLALAAFALPACTPGAEEEAHAAAATPALRTATVEAASWTPSVEITGSLEPVSAVQLGFDVPGRIEELLVTRGQRVSKGDPIARLDDTLARAQLAQAEAGLSAARAQAEAAESGWGRIEKLGDAVSEQQRTEASAGNKGAQAQLDQAESAVKLARTNVGYHTLRSPIDGIVTNAPDNAGVLVGAGTPTFVIEDLSALRLKGTAEETASWLADGQAATVLPGTPGATQAVAAVVERVIPSLDPSTRRIPVEVRIDSPPPSLRAHAFARATITASAEQPAFSIPRGALVARPEFSVFVLPAAGAPPKRVPIEIVGESGDKLLVLGAIEAGQTVVVDPPHGYGE
jgi:RND family efflux transporter MFP subunit